MKTGEVKSQSLLSKLLDKIKHSALFEMFFDPTSGMVVDPDEVDTEKQIKDLSASTGMSEKEIINIDAAFNEARGNLMEKAKEVEKIPEEKKESRNPFAVDEEDLLLEDDEPEQDEKKRDNSGREIGE